jgi:hypothetical protein
MWRLLGLGMLSLTLACVGSARAQAPPDAKRLEGELEKLRARMNEIEALLKKVKGGGVDLERKGPEEGDGPRFAPFEGKKGPFGGGGFGKKGPMMEGKGPFAGKKDGKGPPVLGEKGEGKGPAFAGKKGEGKGPPWAPGDGDGPPWARRGGSGRGPAFGPPWMRGGYGGGRETMRTEDIERRLDRILRDLEDLRRDIGRR